MGTQNFELTLRPTTGADNDHFADRIALPNGMPIQALGNNVGASREPGEPSHGTGFEQSGSVWWTWTAPSDMSVELTTTGSSISTNIAVYTGTSLFSLEEVIASDAADSAILDGLDGTTYHIAISGIRKDSTGSIQLQIRPTHRREYSIWAAQYFPSGGAAALQSADPDSDGKNNFHEYAFASDPTKPDLPANSPRFENYPEAAYVYTRPGNPTDVRYSHEFSNDLTTWLPITLDMGAIETTSDSNGQQTVRIRLSDYFEIKKRVYFRVLATEEPSQ